MKLNKKRILALSAAVLTAGVIPPLVAFEAPVAGGTPDVYFVAPDGRDGWSGSLPEPNPDRSDGPLATLEGARLKLRELAVAGRVGPVEVQVREGEYFLDQTVVFSSRDLGNGEFPVTIRAFPGEEPILSGGIKLANWEPMPGKVPGMAVEASGRLWFADLPDDLPRGFKVTSLYDGTEMMPRASSEVFRVSPDHVMDPNNLSPKAMIDKVDWDAAPLSFRRDFRFVGDDIKDWSNPSDIEIVLSPKNHWLVNFLPLERIDTETRTAHFSIDSTYSIVPENPYRVENAIEYLDEPGEWVYDSTTGRIYLWPVRDPRQSDIRIPSLQEFIRVEGTEDGLKAQNVHFRGLTFRHGKRDDWEDGDKGLQHDWGIYDNADSILRFRHAERSSVIGCVFEASSGGGVRADLHAQHLVVADNVFRHLGATGVLFCGYGAGLKDVNKHNIVRNNYIHHVGTLYKHAPAIFLSQSGHNLITHNTIHDLAYTGIVVSGYRIQPMVLAKPLANRREWVGSMRLDEIRPFVEDITLKEAMQWISFDLDRVEALMHARENRIEYNEIYRVMLELDDGNAIYLSAMGRNNAVRFNYMHGVTGTRGNIRADDLSTYTMVTHNVAVGGDIMFKFKGPAEIRNNFAIDTRHFMVSRLCPTEIDQNVFYYTKGNGAFHRLRGNGARNKGIDFYYQLFDRWSNSLVYDTNLPEEFLPGRDLVPVDRRGGAPTGLLVADPLFDTDAFAEKVFRFRSGSPALKLGIEPIDLSGVGSTLAK